MERITTVEQNRVCGGSIFKVSWVTAIRYKARGVLKYSKRVTVHYSMGNRPIDYVQLGRGLCDVSVLNKANQIHNFHMMGSFKLFGLNCDATDALDVIIGILKLSDISDRAAGIVQSVTESYKI